MMRMRGRLHGIGRDADIAIGAVLEADRAGQAGSELADRTKSSASAVAGSLRESGSRVTSAARSASSAIDSIRERASSAYETAAGLEFPGVSLVATARRP